VSSSARCSVCLAAQEDPQLDVDIVRGVSSVELARRYPLSRWALDRHRSADRGHISEDVRAAAWAEQRAQVRVRPADMIERLLDLAADATTVRRRAINSGQDRIVLASIETERQLLSDLMSRLGISTESVRQEALSVDALNRAYVDLGAEDPHLFFRLSDALRRHGAPHDLIAAIEEVAAKKITTTSTEETR
jgi:hypothetical protein